MRARTGLGGLAVALLVAGGSVARAAIQTVVIGDLYDGGTVNLAPGDALEVRLAAGPAGCAWKPAFDDPAVLKADSGEVGPTTVFRYKAISPGSSSVGLACLNPADPVAPAGALFRVLVTVKDSILVPRGLILEQPDSGSDIFLVQGDLIQVRLPANPSTGYSWAIAGNAPSVLRPIGEPKYDPPDKGKPGAGGTQTLEFRVVGGGGAFLDLVYKRPSEKDAAPARRWGVFVAAAAIAP